MSPLQPGTWGGPIGHVGGWLLPGQNRTVTTATSNWLLMQNNFVIISRCFIILWWQNNVWCQMWTVTLVTMQTISDDIKFVVKCERPLRDAMLLPSPKRFECYNLETFAYFKMLCNTSRKAVPTGTTIKICKSGDCWNRGKVTPVSELHANAVYRGNFTRAFAFTVDLGTCYKSQRGCERTTKVIM